MIYSSTQNCTMKLNCIAIIALFFISCKEEQKNTKENKSEQIVTDTTLQNKKIGIERTLHVECIDKGGDMENGFSTECFFRNSNLEQAYDAYILRNKYNDDGKWLEPKLPLEDLVKDGTDYPISIVYKYSKKDELTVDLIFPGGETTIVFAQEFNDVKVSSIHSPD